MTDSYASMNMASAEKVGIPSQLIGGDRPASIEAKKTFHVSPAENSTNQPGTTVRFTLPNQPNTYLMPDVALVFDFVNTGAVGCAFDGDANCLIDRYRLYHGSQLLIDIPEYSRLQSIIRDVTQAPDNGSTIRNLLSEAPRGGVLATAAGANQARTLAQALDCTGVVPRYNPAQMLVPEAGAPHRIVLPLMCPLIGSIAQKAWCSHAATAAPLRVEIDLASNAKALITTHANVGTVKTYTTENTQLHATYVQVSSTAQSLIDQAVGGVYALNTYSYAHSQNSHAVDTRDINALLPFSYSSLKHLLTGQYAAGVEDQLHLNVTGRQRNNVHTVFYQIGASRVPSQPMNLMPEIASHLCKCFGVSSDLLQISNYLERQSFGNNAQQPIVAIADNESFGGCPPAGTFAIGIDLEAFGATSSATRISNGVNTTALTIHLNWKQDVATPAGGAEVHTWGCYDMLVTFANGQAYARF